MFKTDKSNSDSPKNLRLILRAFHYGNYRLFFGGQSISLIGTWMQRIALSWLVFRLTNSAFLLGLVGFSSQIPAFLFAPIAGVVADRRNRYHIIVVTQILSMIQAFILSFLVLTNTIAVWHIILLGIFLGLVNAFDIPARQSFIIQMVEKKEDLGNAIALNSLLFNGARFLGPSIAGVLIAAVGEGVCFLLNGLSYIAIISALLAMKITPRKTKGTTANILQELKEGFVYTFSIPPIRSTLILLALVSLVGMPYTILMPIFARDILHGGPHTLGFLMAGVGTGAGLAAIFLASRKSAQGLERIIPIATSIFSIGLIAFSRSHVFWLSLIFISLAGFGIMLQNASCNTFLQTIVDDDKRGRLMSFYTMSHMGTAPFGSLISGGIASNIGAPNTLTIGGILCILGLLVYAGKLSSFRRKSIPQSL